MDLPKNEAKTRERPDTTIAVTRELRRLIQRFAKADEFVDATLRRLFREQGHGEIGTPGRAGRMLLTGSGKKTSIRVSKALKAWIVGRIRGYETLEHCIRRLCGISGPKRRNGNGSR